MRIWAWPIERMDSKIMLRIVPTNYFVVGA